MNENKASLRSVKNGPLIAKNIKKFSNSRGDEIAAKESMSLCRCGRSEEKPYCDGAHDSARFNDSKEYGRRPDRVKDYEGKDITVHDNRGICAHVGYCTQNSPKVFDTSKRPWIEPDAAEAENTAKTIRMCPSGALSYTKNQEKWLGDENEPEIQIFKDGPYIVKGGVEYSDDDGNKPHLRQHYTICRCGYSKNKPFCDGTHIQARFVDEKN